MKKYKPYSILTLGLISFFFSFIPALFLCGINWKRLGNPKKAKKYYVISIILTLAITISFITYIWFDFFNDNYLEYLNIIPVLNIIFIFFFYSEQKELIKEYEKKEENKDSSNTVLLVLICAIYGVFVLGPIFSVIFYGKYKTGFSMRTIILSMLHEEEYNDYMDTLKNEENYSYEKQIKLIKPYYEIIKHNRDLGAETSFIFGLKNLQAGNFSKGKEIIELAYENFPEDEEIIKIRNGIDVFKNIDKYHEYESIVGLPHLC